MRSVREEATYCTPYLLMGPFAIEVCLLDLQGRKRRRFFDNLNAPALLTLACVCIILIKP